MDRAPDLLAAARLTVLVFWNRGCPECTAVAMGMQDLADSLRPLEAQVVGVAFGPDDPVSLRDQLRQNRIAVPQLWDAGAQVAALYDVGLQHLRVFLVTPDARIQAVFEDRIPSLAESVLPAARQILRARGESTAAGRSGSSPRAVPGEAPLPPSAGPGEKAEPSSATPIPSILSALKLDARLKALSTEGAAMGDRGLYNESLANGALFSYRYDVRLPWTPAPWIEVVPWLRVSNESDEDLTEGAEQISHAAGSLTLSLRHGRTAATLGAFQLRVAPLLLQRWDAADAPPLGGVSGCACGAGATGLSQRSLEVLGPDYTFEGLSVSRAETWAALRAWFAIPRWEHPVLRSAPARERESARYRRVLSGSLLDLGPNGTRDAASGLPSPVGLRVGVLSVGDDARTLGPEYYHPPQHDEWGWVAQARVAPGTWLSGDAQWVGWRLDESGRRTDETAYLAGIQSVVSWRPLSAWARLHRLRTEPDFAPLYRALTYEPNEDGWRIAGGLAGWRLPASRRERLSAEVFYRSARETEEREAPGLGRSRSTVLGVSVGVRTKGDLLAELHGVETKTQRPVVALERSRGLSLNLRWERWAFLDPQLRVDAIRREAWSEARNIWQTSLWVRLVR